MYTPPWRSYRKLAVASANLRTFRRRLGNFFPLFLSPFSPFLLSSLSPFLFPLYFPLFPHVEKNRPQLLAWRVAIGLHQSITLNFLVAGHTKLAPDWCFGLLKRAFKRHAVSSLSEFKSVVCGSACVNTAQLVGREDGTSLVSVGNWQTNLSPFSRTFRGIKKYHHFR